MNKLMLACALCFVLAGCGDDKKAGNPFEGMPGMPGGTSTADMMKGGGTVKLTDEMMERYVAAVKALKDIDTPGEAMLARYKFSTQQWVQVSMIIGTSTARSAMSGARPQLEKQLAEMKQRLAQAGPDEKAMFELQIENLEAQLESMKDVGEANDIDKHNMEVLERWKDRLDAAGY